MNIKITKNLNTYGPEWVTAPKSYISYKIQSGDEIFFAGSDEEALAILQYKLGLNLHPNDLVRLPISFPIDIEDLIKTSSFQYSRLTYEYK